MSGPIAALRRAALPVLKHPRVEPLVSIGLRAALVRESPGFAARELGHSVALARYTLRGGHVRVLLQHGTPDVHVFDEIFYQGVYDPPEEVARVLEALPGPPRVVDIGANVGMFGARVLSRYPEARIVAFEPDPRNAEVHRRTVAANAAEPRWTLVQAAAAPADGELRFHTGNFARSGPAADDDATAGSVPAVDVLPYLADCDLIKLDAEGSEWAILDDPRFGQTSARAIALEYHPDRCPEPDARAAATRRLTGAGFEVRWQPTPVEAGYGSLWAWR